MRGSSNPDELTAKKTDRGLGTRQVVKMQVSEAKEKNISQDAD